jgi:hypothetical protein
MVHYIKNFFLSWWTTTFITHTHKNVATKQLNCLPLGTLNVEKYQSKYRTTPCFVDIVSSNNILYKLPLVTIMLHKEAEHRASITFLVKFNNTAIITFNFLCEVCREDALSRGFQKVGNTWKATKNMSTQ